MKMMERRGEVKTCTKKEEKEKKLDGLCVLKVELSIQV